MVLCKLCFQIVNRIPVFPTFFFKHLFHLLTTLCPDGLKLFVHFFIQLPVKFVSLCLNLSFFLEFLLLGIFNDCLRCLFNFCKSFNN